MSAVRKVRSSPALAASLVVLVAAVGGVAIAAIPDASGVIHGCYSNTTGAMRVIDSGKTCDAGETSLNWNQSGPQGPAGATGATGPQGPAGGTGGLGAAIVSPRSAEVEIPPPGKDAFVDVKHMTLDPGNYVVSGNVTVIGRPQFTRLPDRGVDRGRRVLGADVHCQLRITPLDSIAGGAIDEDVIHFGGSTLLKPVDRQDEGGFIHVAGTAIGAITSVNYKARMPLQNVAQVRTRSRAVVACEHGTTNPPRSESRAIARIIAIQVGSLGFQPN